MSSSVYVRMYVWPLCGCHVSRIWVARCLPVDAGDCACGTCPPIRCRIVVETEPVHVHWRSLCPLLCTYASVWKYKLVFTSTRRGRLQTRTVCVSWCSCFSCVHDGCDWTNPLWATVNSHRTQNKPNLGQSSLKTVYVTWTLSTSQKIKWCTTTWSTPPKWTLQPALLTTITSHFLRPRRVKHKPGWRLLYA